MQRSSTERAWAIGGLVFAATLMVMLGVWEALIGIAAIANDAFFAVQPNYPYRMSAAGWGWVHLLLGVLVLLVGLSLFRGALWARAVGILLAALVAINNFFFLPFYPIWSIVVIGLAVFVIWALASTSGAGIASDLAESPAAEEAAAGPAKEPSGNGATGERPAGAASAAGTPGSPGTPGTANRTDKTGQAQRRRL